MRSVALTTVSSGDDGWIHQLRYLPIKWLFPNTTSNLANHSWLIPCTVFSLPQQPFPPPPRQASHDRGAQLPERPGSQQAPYSVTQMVIHINHKRHQTDPLFPAALRQTHPTPVLKWKSCLWTEKFEVLKRHSDVLKLKRRDSLFFFYQSGGIETLECFRFSTPSQSSLQNVSYGLWCTDEREHYADHRRGWKRQRGERRVPKIKWRRRLRPPAAFRRCEGLSRFQCSASVPQATREAVCGDQLGSLAQRMSCVFHAHTHLNTHWNTRPLKLSSLSEGARFGAPAYKYLFADSLLVFWALTHISSPLRLIRCWGKGAGPQPSGLQYERVACLEQSRTEEMMRPEKKSMENWEKNKTKKKGQKKRIGLMMKWSECCVCVFLQVCVCVCVCVCVSACICKNLLSPPAVGGKRGGRVCSNGGAMPCVYVD